MLAVDSLLFGSLICFEHPEAFFSLMLIRQLAYSFLHANDLHLRIQLLPAVAD